MENYAELLFIDEVLALQEQDGSAEKFQNFYPKRTAETLGDSERQFIEERESFYIASVSSKGWPYVQHRGGPRGFLKVIGETRLGFIDYPGNRQFITMGHSKREKKVALFLMDYEKRARLKILGQLNMQQAKDTDSNLLELLSTTGQANPERVATIEVMALDWNCPKYIPRLYTEDTVHQLIDETIKRLVADGKIQMI